MFTVFLVAAICRIGKHAQYCKLCSCGQDWWVKNVAKKKVCVIRAPSLGEGGDVWEPLM